MSIAAKYLLFIVHANANVDVCVASSTFHFIMESCENILISFSDSPLLWFEFASGTATGTGSGIGAAKIISLLRVLFVCICVKIKKKIKLWKTFVYERALLSSIYLKQLRSSYAAAFVSFSCKYLRLVLKSILNTLS